MGAVCAPLSTPGGAEGRLYREVLLQAVITSQAVNWVESGGSKRL